MKYHQPYLLVFFLLCTSVLYGQKKVLPDDATFFGDSVKTLLNNTRNSIAMETGDSFALIWPQLGADLQQKAIKQMLKMESLGLKIRPYQETYCLALANAVQIEAASNDKIADYLNTAEQVIASENHAAIIKFLRFANTLFSKRALYHERSNQLYIGDADYYFEFVAPEIIEEVVEEEPAPAEDEWFDDLDANPDEDDWDTEWEEDDWENYEEQDWEEEPAYDEDQAMIDAMMGPSAMPIVEGAVVHFENITLNFKTPYDSVFLFNTSGDYIIATNTFVGKGGKFDWSITGMPADSVFVTFNEYAFNTTKAELKAEGVKLTYLERVDDQVEGVFEFKSVKHDSINSKYPRFKSYYNTIRLKNLGKGLVYKGGLTLDGNKLKSASVMSDYSYIEAQDQSAKKFRAKSKIFEFQDSTITSERTSLIIYQGNDSIYHPAVRIKYDYKNKYLITQKDKGAYRNTPFSSSFFNVDFTADILRWDLNSDSLDISILQARNIVPSIFESTDHYNYEDYRALEGPVYNFNPLGMAIVYARLNGIDQFYVSELAKHYKKDVRLIKGAMVDLAQKGLVGYDSQSDLITIKPKAFHMYESKLGETDYDNIIISSVTDEKPNATVNFQKRELIIRGIDGFKISDSLNVVIEPDSSQITMLKDRDFTFNGKVFAGNFEYIGRDFTFRYDSFLIYLNEIDSIRFYVKDENSRGGNGRRQVENSLVGVDSTKNDGSVANNLQSSSGTLYINKPNNKSSKVKYLNYPKFDSEKGAIVYFDRKAVLGGVYDKSMYFLVPPFNLDSLGGADASAIAFDGTFVSSGMFPVFEERLSIQKDFSLGFDHQVPPEGYQLYQGEGRFYENLKLNKNGIRGNGRIDFLTSTLESKDFIFYPDSVTGSGSFMEIKEEDYNGITYPQASLNNYKMHWLPKKDSMYVENIDEPLQFYNQTASLDGTAIITGKGVYGSGTLETRGSESISKNITLEHDNFRSRHTQFQLKSDNPDKPALYGDDVRVSFDLNDNYALINPEIEGEAALAFPYAQFKTSITEARWDLNEEKITMSKPDNVPLENSYFYTTREDLDSLSFMATDAEYDIKTLELKVSGIPYIIVADAKITPENNEVLILENAKIGQLLNTTIILDTLNGYHKLTEGVIDIKSRNSFSGYATYQFTNSEGEVTPIKMENFRLEQIANPDARRKENQFSQHTVANGSVTEGQNLLVSPGFYYKGDMILYAHLPTMELDGYVKLDIDEPGYNKWIQYKSSANQTEVAVDYNNAVTEEGRRLEAGLHFSAGDNSLYSTFVTERFNPDDEDFFTPSGVLHFDKIKREFAIEDTAKAAGNKFQGQVYRYNHLNSNVMFEGRAKFLQPKKDMEVISSVIGNGNLNTLEFNLNTMFSINFVPVPTQAFDMMAVDLLDVITNMGAPEGTGDPTQLLYKLADLSGQRAAEEYEARSLQEYTTLAGFTKETSASMVFANIDLKWSVEYKAFYSTGKLGLSNIQRTDINGAFDGFFEVRRNEDGVAALNFFMKASPDSWYFFSYEDNRLLIYSSNNAFNNLISKKSNGSKSKIGDLVFAPADKAETLNFINRFRLQYYGIDEPYELDAAVEETEDTEGFDETKTEEDDGFEDDDDGF